MIIFDIGACVGIFIDEMFAKHGEENIEVIYAFEPLIANYDFLIEKYKDNEKIKLFNVAISDSEGQAPFYKKWYAPKNGSKRGFDFAGNAGSSLKGDKSNVSGTHDIVKTRKLSSIIKEEGLHTIHIVKIDTEGSEYDILQDIFENKLYNKMDKIYFEDHERKVKSLQKKKEIILALINKLNIKDKFYTQKDHLEYIPL